MIIGSVKKLEVGKIYKGLSNIEYENYPVQYMVLREATSDEYKQSLADLGITELNKFEQFAVDNGASFYEVSVD